MDTKKDYMQEADWYERKVQSQAEEIEELKDQVIELAQNNDVLEKNLDVQIKDVIGLKNALAELEFIKKDVAFHYARWSSLDEHEWYEILEEWRAQKENQ